MPTRRHPKNSPPWRKPLVSKEPYLDASVVVEDGSSDSWWSGTQFGFASVPIAAATAALSLSVAIANSFHSFNDGFQYPNSLTADESHQVVQVDDDRVPFVFSSDDDFVPRSFEDDAYPILTVLPVAPVLQVWRDDEVRLPVLDEETFAYPLAAPIAQAVASLFGPQWDDSAIIAVAVSPFEDDHYPYWSQRVAPAAVLSSPIWDDDVWPLTTPDELYEWSATPQVFKPVPLALSADDDFVPPPALDDSFYQPQVWVASTIFVQGPAWDDGALAVFSFEDDAYAYWTPQAPKSVPVVLSADDDIVPQPATLALDDGFNYQPIWVASAIFVQGPQWDDGVTIFLPSLTVGDSMQMVVVGDDRLPIVFSHEDDFVFTAATPLQVDEQYWLTFEPQRTSIQSWVAVGMDEVVTAATPLQVDEQYWFTLPPQRATLIFDVFTATDEVIPSQGDAVGYASFSQRAISDTVIISFGVVDELPVAAAPLQVADYDWTVFTPSPAVPVLYLSTWQDEIPSVADEAYWFYAPPIPSVVHVWQPADNDEVPTAATPLQVVESDWQVYTPPLLDAKALWQFQEVDEIATVSTVAIDEQYWLQSITPPSAPCTFLWSEGDEVIPLALDASDEFWPFRTVLPAPISISWVSDDFVPQRALVEDEFWPYRVLVPAPVTTYWVDGDEVVTPPVPLRVDEFYVWQIYTVPPAAPIVTLWADDGLLQAPFIDYVKCFVVKPWRKTFAVPYETKVFEVRHNTKVFGSG